MAARHEELADLKQAASTASAAARAAEAEVEEARAKAATARERWVEAEADGTGTAVAQARKAHKAAEGALEGRLVKAEAAQLRADREAAEVSNFNAANWRDLVAEETPDAIAARDEIVQAATALIEADRAWYASSGRVSGHLAAGGMQSRGNLPVQHGLEQAIRDVKRALAQVGEPPAPLPHFQAARFAEQQEADAVKAREERDGREEREERQRQAASALGEPVVY